MPEPIEQVLFEVRLLKSWLYGDGQGHEGDIPQIKGLLEEHKAHFDDHSKRITILETQVVERTGLSKKKAGFIGGIGAVLGVAIASAFDYLLRR